MKKSLLAVAVAAALPAVAYAQSNVTLYGMIDTGYMSKKWTDNNATHSKSVGFGEAGGVPTMLGFRGSEDLGSGLKGEWVIETGWSANSQRMFNVRTINAGHQVDTLGPANDGGRSMDSLNRQSFVALTGGFGSVRVGYQRTNFYDLSTYSGFTLCNEGVQGCDGHIAGGVVIGAAGSTRGNGVTYISPNLGGLTVQAQYGSGTDLNEFDHINQTDTKAERMGLMGIYRAGGLSVGAGYSQMKAGTNAAAGATSVTTTTTGKAYQLAAAYKLPMVTVGATFVKVNNGAAGAAELDTKAYQISASMPVTPAVELYAGLGKVKSELGNNTTPNDGKSWQVGSRYRFSKRTFAYLHYGVNKDDGVAATAIDKKDQIGLGLAHIF